MKKRNKSRNKKNKMTKLQNPIQTDQTQAQHPSVESINSHQSTTKKDLNIPYIQTGEELGRDVSQLIEFFMEDPDATIRPTPEIASVTAFCSQEHLQDLQTRGRREYCEKVALIDDWADDGSGQWTSLGPLNEQELYVVLLHKTRINSDSQTTFSAHERLPLRLDKSTSYASNRRTIFITDINPWSMGAIISSATSNQARGLRRSFYRCLASKGFLGEIPQVKKLPIIQLEFDLPYYAMRTTLRHNRPKDSREKRNGIALRNVIDISFLSRSSDPSLPIEVDSLCQAHMTLQITGTDESSWTAYFFVDTYFEHKCQRESPGFYEEQRKDVPDDLYIDPLTIGRSTTQISTLSPRDYFMLVLEARLRNLEDEWHNLVTKMRSNVEHYIQTCPFTGNTLSNTIPPQPLSTVWQSRDTTTRVRKVLDELEDTLKATVDEWTSCNKEILPDSIAQRTSRYMPEIRGHFKNLEKHLNVIRFLQQACDSYRDHLDSVMDQETRRLAQDGNWRATLTQFMSIVTLGLVGPLTVAAGMLSMQSGAIPSPFGANTASFFSLCIILMILFSFPVAAIMKWGQIKHMVSHYLTRESGQYAEDQELA